MKKIEWEGEAEEEKEREAKEEGKKKKEKKKQKKQVFRLETRCKTYSRDRESRCNHVTKKDGHVVMWRWPRDKGDMSLMTIRKRWSCDQEREMVMDLEEDGFVTKRRRSFESKWRLPARWLGSDKLEDGLVMRGRWVSWLRCYLAQNMVTLLLLRE